MTDIDVTDGAPVDDSIAHNDPVGQEDTQQSDPGTPQAGTDFVEAGAPDPQPGPVIQSEVPGSDQHEPEAADTGDAEDSDADADADGESDEDTDGESVDDGESDEYADGESDDDSDEESDNPLEVEGEVAADYLEELLDIADLDGDIDTYVESGRAHVSIITDSDTLVGRDGEVLDALQELSRLAVLVDTGQRSRLMLDIGGHRDKRRRELQDLAADAIEEVKETGESVRLAPMNPFERKIVHDCVADASLYSESEGEEPNRRVIVMPAED